MARSPVRIEVKEVMSNVKCYTTLKLENTEIAVILKLVKIFLLYIYISTS